MISMTSDKKIALILFFMLGVGVCTGAFFEISMTGAGKTQLMDFLSAIFAGTGGQGFFHSFWDSLKIWTLLLLIPFFTPYLPPLAVICPFLPLLKGITLGFSATMLVETFGIKGAWYIISTMLPQNLLQIPILCILISMSLSMCSKAKRKALHIDARLYYLSYGIGGFIIFISCLLEAFLMQFAL